jgi:hypothetical protein
MNYLRLILFCFTVVFVQCLKAQDNKFNVKLSGGQVTNVRLTHLSSFIPTYTGDEYIPIKNPVFHFRTEMNYSLSKNFQLGLYLGLSDLTVFFDPDEQPVKSTYTNSTGFFYGVQANYHLLPLLFEQLTRFDIYIPAQLGLLTKQVGSDSERHYNEHTLEAGIGLGAAINFTRKFGIFGEALGGRFYYSNFNWRAGLSFRF